MNWDRWPLVKPCRLHGRRAAERAAFTTAGFLIALIPDMEPVTASNVRDLCIIAPLVWFQMFLLLVQWANRPRFGKSE